MILVADRGILIVEKVERENDPNSGYYTLPGGKLESFEKGLNNLEELLKFKGIGRKTANIVITFAFNKPGIAVDIHVHRISNRLGWVKTKTPDETELVLRETLPNKYWIIINNLFVRFGQNICLPRNPKCRECPVNNHCNYYQEVIS